MMYYFQRDIVAGDQQNPDLVDTLDYYTIGDIAFVYSQRHSTFMNHYKRERFKHTQMQEMPEEAFAYHEELFEYIFDTTEELRNKPFKS